MATQVDETTQSINSLSIKEVVNEEIEDENDENSTVNELNDSNNAPEVQIKHPLQNRWTLWFDAPANGKATQSSWADQLKKVVTFDTVEDFWRIFNNIRPASKISMIGANYHLFKENIEPKWEHNENIKGGKWIITCKSKEQLDKMWLWMVLALIGEGFEDENEICGCVVSIRKGGDRLALWTKTSSNEPAQRRIGAQLKKTLELSKDFMIGYQAHSDALKRNSSFNNRSRYEL